MSGSARRRCTVCTRRKREFEVRGKPSPCAKATMWRSLPRERRWSMRCWRPAGWRTRGLQCRVLSMHTVKPLDVVAAVLRAGRQCRALITVEEHMVHGGLGEACAAVLMQARVQRALSHCRHSQMRIPSRDRRRIFSVTTAFPWKAWRKERSSC
jgi:hypothetical protein